VIKAGRRKFSRKKSGKAVPLSAKLPDHIPVSGRQPAACSRHVAQIATVSLRSVLRRID
jgi:hypothetical protein